MTRLRSSALGLLAVAWVGFGLSVLTMQSTAARISLSQSVGPPGGQVAVPMTVVVPEGVEIGSFTMAVRFATKDLTFASIEVGGLGQGVGAEATSAVKIDGTDTIVELVVATPEKDGVRAPLPAGPLAQLMLTVSKDAKPETVLPLKVQVTATGTKGGTSVKAETADSSVVVSTGAVISCFFFMH